MTDTNPAAAEGLPKNWELEFGDMVRFDGTSTSGVVRGRSEIQGKPDRFFVRYADALGEPKARWLEAAELVRLEEVA